VITAAGTVWRYPVFGRGDIGEMTREANTMIALVSDERVQQLANECIELSKRTDDAVTATELLKLSNRVLQLATRRCRHGGRFRKTPAGDHSGYGD
jgi:hypothetical protein